MASGGLDIRITGTDDLARVARALKDAGDKELRKELLRGINRGLKPAKAAVKEAARSELPKGGGLNEFVASAKIGSSTRSAGRNPGVRITGKKSGHDIYSIDKGRVRHLVFGRPPYVDQAVQPGFFTRTLEQQSPLVRREVVQAIEIVARKVTR